jgi:hypothetical protein
VNTSTFDNVSVVGPGGFPGAFNRAGKFTDGTTFGGALDDNGNAYSATLLGSSLSMNGYTFNLGTADGPKSRRSEGSPRRAPVPHFARHSESFAP